jgi:hypothetical protein
MNVHSFTSLTIRFLFGLAALAIGVAATHAGEPPTRFFDSAARQMLSQLQAGEGWAVVSERSKVKLLAEGEAADCVKYRVVTNYKSGMVNDQFVLEVQYSAETPWILLEFGMPAASCTSLAAAKKANEAVTLLDTLIPGIEGPLASEENAELRAFGVRLVGVLRGQRAALVDLIQKDIQAIK